MNIVTKFLFAFALLVSGFSAHAADLNLFTFLGANPLKGVEVELDGVVVGETGQQGSYSGELKAGKHRIVLQKRGAELAKYVFEVEAGQSADITFGFVNFLDEPEVSLERYSEGDVGAPGQVSGYVTNTGTFAVAGATVTLDGTALSAVTDDAGTFQIEAPRGVYTLLVEHPEYQTASLNGLRVVANVGVEANVTLRQESTAVTTDGSVEEVVVLGTYKPATSAVDMERFSTAVTDAISLDDLLRFGDSDVASTLKRIVGVSVSGGKFAIVRGLDGRYIASTLNGLLMPSTDPFRRDVELDLFPSDILAGIEIQKNFSANLPGDTTGGVIQIKTRNVPDEPVNKLSLSLGYTTGVTGESLLSYEGGDTDFFGVDDGTRELPAALDRASNGGQDDLSVAENARLAPTLSNIWLPRRQSAGPDYELGYSFGDIFELNDGSLGAYVTGSFGRDHSSRQDARIDVLGDVESSYQWDVITTSLSAYGVLGYEADSNWNVRSKSILLRDTDDRVSIQEGFDLSDGNRNEFTQTVIEYVERQFLAQQFEGQLFLLDDHELNWRAGLSQTSRYSPDRREYRRGATRLNLEEATERSFNDLTEDSLDLGLDYSLSFDVAEDVFTKVTAGVLLSAKDRDVELARFAFRIPDHSNAPDLSQDIETVLQPANFQNDGVRLVSASASVDSYKATQDNTAVFVTTATDIGEAWSVVAGLRQDNYTAELDFPNSRSAFIERDSNELLPALGVTYRLNEDWQFRGTYGRTVSRPNITEISPSRFYDQQGRLFIGCGTSCRDSLIDNYDLRAEYYYNDGDSISLALFYKEIADPLERAISDSSGSATSALTFRNSERATLEGIEIDGSWTLMDSLDHGVKLSGNVSLIDSQITLDDRGRALELESSRELQGQSPLLANFQLGYDHFGSGQKLTLLLNYFDDRIDRVSRRPRPSVVEKGRLQINANYEVPLGDRSSLKFKVKNLLDAEIEYQQGNQIVERYRQGAEFSLGYSYDFAAD